MQKIHIITHIDMDGACSYLVTSWFHQNRAIEYTTINSSTTFREQFLHWLLKHNIDEYDIIYILDLDCYDAKDLIDKPNIRIFDHHSSHVEKIKENGKYKNCKFAVKEFSSCCLFLYKIFSKTDSFKISKYQKLLLVYVDDYDAYTLKHKESLFLNWVYTSYNNWFESFAKRFYDGFTGFTIEESSMVKIVKNRICQTLKTMPVYSGYIDGHHTICIFIERDVNEVLDATIKKYKPDICVAVLLNKNKVSWRRHPDKETDVSIYAAQYTSGGGHKYAAGGIVTEDFMNLAKGFQQVKNDFTN